MTHSPALTLAPCPMCGSATAPRLVKVEATDEAIPGGTCHTPAHFSVVCDASTESRLDGCGTAGPGCHDDRSAVRAWNRRPELAASADAGCQQLPEGWMLDQARESEPGIVELGSLDGDGEFCGFVTIDTANYMQPAAAMPIAQAIIAAIARPAPATMANGLTESETSATASVAGLSVSAQGDEREAFGAWLRRENAAGSVTDMERGWQARAQVAQGDEVDARWQFIRRHLDTYRRVNPVEGGWEITLTLKSECCVAGKWTAASEADFDAARAQQGGQR